LYGAAEFSRDVDFAVLSEADNLSRLQGALDELQAERIAVPPFEQVYLDMGLAVHFRCRRADLSELRIDVMSTMRGLDPFEALWVRRTTHDYAGLAIDLLSLPDLIRAKKTQREKDWPMISRLVNENYFRRPAEPTAEQIDFWLREMRTPKLLAEVANKFPTQAKSAAANRDLLRLAEAGDEGALAQALWEEEQHERAADREYWRPLKQELERLRRAARGS
jgi:hypothetical protein